MTIITPFFRHIFDISYTRGKEFRRYCPNGFYSQEDNDSDEWWKARFLIYGFNEACKDIAAISLKVWDDSTIAVNFWTMTKGKLPHLSYILRKPEPLGAEFNTVTCSSTGALLLIEVQRGKEGMNHTKYHK